jgi:hypothetical protein
LLVDVSLALSLRDAMRHLSKPHSLGMPVSRRSASQKIHGSESTTDDKR